MKYLFCLVFTTIFCATAFYTFVFAKSDKADGVVAQNINRPYSIEIHKADGSQEQKSGMSASRTSFFIARDLGIDTIEADKFRAFPDIAMGIGSTITMSETPYYQINDGKKHINTRSWAKTVGDLLIEGNVPQLGLDDKINFSPDSELYNNMTVNIIRVARTIVIESEPIDYKIQKVDDPTLDQGKTRIKQAGAKGTKKLTYEVIREDGIQVAKTLTSSEITSEPVIEILLIGTKPVITVACRFNDAVISAAGKYGLDPNSLCTRMMKESRGNPNSDGGDYKGLFQYKEGFWNSVSAKAGYAGASIWDATAQIYSTAWAWSHGYRARWPAN